LELEKEKAAEMERMKEQMRAELEAEKQAEMEALKRKLAEENEEKERLIAEKTREAEELKETVRQARLSQSMATSMEDEGASSIERGAEEMLSDIGDSVSQINNLGALQEMVEETVKSQLEKTTSDQEMKQLREEVLAQKKMVELQVQELLAKNAQLEEEALAKDSRIEELTAKEPEAQVSGMDLSPPANGTPCREKHSAPSGSPEMSPIPMTPGSGHVQRKYSLLADDDLARKGVQGDKSGSRRKSVAQQALAGLGISRSGGHEQPGMQREWWAEQRATLMADLYNTDFAPAAYKKTPTPARSKTTKETNATEAAPRQLASNFDAEAAQDDTGLRSRGSGKEEWMETIPQKKGSKQSSRGGC